MSAHTNTLTPARSGSALSPWTVRGTLALDAVVTGGNGLAYLAFSGPLGELLGAGRSTVVGVGALLLGYALAVGALAARRRPPAFGVRAVIDLNLVWVVLSLVAMELWLEPTTAGFVWIPAQAAVVAVFAVLQFTALRRRSRA
ncbi:hypothetical protein [Kitasatospora brasiliensis]|uniref:hypothetical protein n=1 Tax=Kitasatospora brasiliensis TaxID=3058040 RepID=UPI0029310187|nr:hypothetical protein [Kitasatospora sp. K002]